MARNAASETDAIKTVYRIRDWIISSFATSESIYSSSLQCVDEVTV